MLHRVQQGDNGYPTQDFNRIVGAAETVINGGYAGADGSPVGGSHNPALIRIKNMSGGDVPAFGVLRVTQRLFVGVDNPVTSAQNGGIEMKGEAPNDDDNQTLCIVQEAIETNGLGRGIIWAATGVMINVTDSSGRSSLSIKYGIRIA